MLRDHLILCKSFNESSYAGMTLALCWRLSKCIPNAFIISKTSLIVTIFGSILPEVTGGYHDENYERMSGNVAV